MMRFFRTYLWDGLRYKGKWSQWSHYIHRFTGLATVLFMVIHILDTSTVYFFPDLYPEAIDIYRKTLFMLMEIVLVFCVLFHGVNGLRLALFDLFPRFWGTRFRAPSLRTVFIVSILLWLPAAIIMGQNLIQNNFMGG